MSQTWNPPLGTTRARIALKTDLPAMAESLRSMHSGASAPSATVAYMLWADTALTLLKQRNAADSAWITIGALGASLARGAGVRADFGNVSATIKRRMLVPFKGFTVERFVLVSATADTGTSGNEWTFKGTNVDDSLELFSGTVGTFTTLGGVGGGALVAETAYELLVDQNANVPADSVLEFSLTKVGAPAGDPLNDVQVWAEGYPTG